MHRKGRLITVTASTGVFLLVGASSAWAHHCTNASKPADSGWRVLVDELEGTLTFKQRTLEQRFAADPEGTMATFSGIVGFDVDSDGDADLSTYIVGPHDQLPETAQSNGAPCKGVVNVGDYFACLAG